MNRPAQEHYLKPLFAPRSFALVGATDDTGRFAGKVLMRMLDFGYKGKIYPVHPRAATVRGMPCFASVRDLPEAPDHVGVVVPAEHVMPVLEDCAARGAKFVTVYTGGFNESGSEEGRKGQEAIAALARRSGMRIMGPNCNGLVNFVDAFAITTSATIAGPRRAAGDIGVIAQSGGGGQVNTMWRAQQFGLGISYEVSCGNSADLNILDFIEFMIEDAATSVILVLAEQIPDGRRLGEIARLAAAREKPIVMVKLGRTEAGSRAAQSHTGAVAASDVVCDAALRQYGIIRVDDCNELYETAMLLRTRRWPRGTRVGGMSVSGGNAVILTDLGAHLGMSWPAYSTRTQERMAEVLPKLASVANPVDFTNAALGKPGIFRHCVEAIAGDENVDVVVPVFTMSPQSDLQQTVDAAGNIDKPLALLWIGACNDNPAYTLQTVVAQGVPVYRNTLACMRALRAAMRYGMFLADFKAGASVPARPPSIDVEGARAKLKASRGKLTERLSKQVLAAYGIAVTREALATDAAAAQRIAREIAQPVAMKIESPDIPHKTEADAIRLGVSGDDAVQRAFAEVTASARRFKADARIDGVLVQQMAAPGLELMIGLTVDSVFGPVVAVGLGGVHVEVLRDLAFRVAPVSHADARAMLRELRAAKILDGVRGAAARDIEALCDLIVRASWLGHDFCDTIAELDINPVIAYAAGAGAVAVDALIVER